MRTVELFSVVCLCLCSLAWASSNREPCRSPSKTSGMLCVGVIYKLDSKNESCKRQSLPYHKHPMEVPADAHHVNELYLGSPDRSEQGLRVRMWSGNMTDHDEHHSQAGHYSMMTTSCGCITVSCTYHSEKNDLIFSFFNVETEIDDLQVFNPPDYCDGMELEEASEDRSFFDLFHD
ncbi:Ependymin-1 [Bagarius yarrelli]|uniref:Ependymin-1 n=1 Tax=Bagarius yarrelli TaxID=175774 RepID=A0A556UET0_BAGYA|nr:Ependymin-1 [Bagarius yarrelli]